jgi:phosphoenolpyruvate-protein phosphotransferase (PTS system enzyme I)
MTLELNGIGVSRGIAIGAAHVLQRDQLEILEAAVPAHLVEREVCRFHAAIEAARQQLRAIRERIPPSTPPEITAFIDTHLLMLDDSMLSLAPAQLIRTRQCSAEWALKLQRDSVVAVFEEMDDAYLRTRKDDVDHVVTRIQRILMAREPAAEAPSTRLKGRIVLADDLTPADTVLMQHEGIAAFVTESGGPLSHTAILARSLGIPAVVGAHHARRYVRDQELLIVDGSHGVVLAAPDEAALKHYRRKQREEKRYLAGLTRLKSAPAVTLDGHTICLQANVELPEDVRAVRKVAADGVGLYRTEFLYMNRPDPPGEEEQLQAYLRVLGSLRGAPVTIRTLDLGADKQVDGGGRTEGRLATNPALGLRAIRLCLKDLTLFRPQLRAILRASAAGPVRLMIPMLSNLQELTQVLALIEETKRELKSQGYRFDPKVPVGGMIEVPAAALSARIFAQHLDFLSLGTNDLIQYTLAIDRIDDEVNYLYDPLHPAVLQLIHLTIRAGHEAGIPVGMCGEMAGDTRYTRLLLGLGLTEFSMHPSALLEVKRIVNATHVDETRKLAAKVLRATSSEELASLMGRINRMEGS